MSDERCKPAPEVLAHRHPIRPPDHVRGTRRVALELAGPDRDRWSRLALPRLRARASRRPVRQARARLLRALHEPDARSRTEATSDMTASQPWDPSQWPRPGCCGACGRTAREAPSGRWWHDGRPCLARTQSIWSVDDIGLKLAVVFVPVGEPLPDAPARWHMHPSGEDTNGIPSSYALCNITHTHSVREFLAREAEEGIR